jgi:hypothetical protein
LLNRCRGLNSYPGFESLPHRHKLSSINNLLSIIGKVRIPARLPVNSLLSLTLLLLFSDSAARRLQNISKLV